MELRVYCAQWPDHPIPAAAGLITTRAADRERDLWRRARWKCAIWSHGALHRLLRDQWTPCWSQKLSYRAVSRLSEWAKLISWKWAFPEVLDCLQPAG